MKTILTIVAVATTLTISPAIANQTSVKVPELDRGPVNPLDNFNESERRRLEEERRRREQEMRDKQKPKGNIVPILPGIRPKRKKEMTQSNESGSHVPFVDPPNRRPKA